MIAITLLITDHLQRITHTHVIPPPKRNSTVCRKEIIKSPDQVTWCYSSTVQWPSSAVQLWWSNLCGGINDICWSKAIKHQEMQYKLYKVDFSIAMLFDEVFPFVERSTPLVTYPLSNFGISCGCVAKYLSSIPVFLTYPRFCYSSKDYKSLHLRDEVPKHSGFNNRTAVKLKSCPHRCHSYSNF